MEVAIWTESQRVRYSCLELTHDKYSDRLKLNILAPTISRLKLLSWYTVGRRLTKKKKKKSYDLTLDRRPFWFFVFTSFFTAGLIVVYTNAKVFHF